MTAFNRHHRKLLGDSVNATATATHFCTFQCNPQINPTAFCFHQCVFICPDFCRFTGDPCPPPATVSPPQHHHHTPLTLPLKISLVVLLATFSLFLLYTLYKFYTVWNRSRRRRRRRRTPPSPENQETHEDFLDHDVLDHPIWYIRTVGLQPSVISAITVVKFKKDDGVVESADCLVCLSEFHEDEMLRLLPKCNHAFHISCIDTWLTSHTNCPLCRAGIVNSAVDPLSPEQNIEDSGVTEETQMAIPISEEDDDDMGEDFDYGQIVEEIQNNAVKAENYNLLMMRRSISLDALSASRISCDVAHRHGVNSECVDGDLGIESVKVDQTRDDKKERGNDQNRSFLRFAGSSSTRRSSQIGPSFMRRSISCNGKGWISRHSSRRDR